MFFLDPSLLIAAGASFVAGVMGYIIARLWVKPIVRYTITKRKLDAELTRYLDQMAGSSGAAPKKNAPAAAEAILRSARKRAMDLLSTYTTEIPYWYRLLLDSRQESPTQASGLLTNLTKIRDPQQRRSRIDAARKELKLNEKKRPDNSRIAVNQHGADCLHTFLLADDTIRGAMLDGSRMIAQMGWNHALGVLETLVLGHAYIGACLMSAGLKGNDRLSLHVECSGPVKGLVVEANAAGEVRGFLKNVPIPVNKPLDDFNLSPFFGAGFLSVTRILEDAKQPFTGRVMMAHGSLAKDLAHYYLTSEQIPTAFSLSVKFDVHGQVVAAGGLFLQALPNADEKIVRKIEARVVTLPSIAVSLAEDIVPKAFVQTHLADFSPRFIDRRPVDFHCHCNRDQIRNILKMLPLNELKDIQAKGPFPVELRCHHCNTTYLFDQEQIDRVVATRFADN